MIRITHILVIVFGIIMFLITYFQYKKKKFNYIGLIIWSSIWFILILSILLFNLMERLALFFLGIRTFDLFVLGAILIIFGLLFLMNSLINENKKHIEEIVEEMAFREIK